jgi:hypothetical protein
MMMDLHSNREGRQAFEQHRALDPKNLQALASSEAGRKAYTSY